MKHNFIKRMSAFVIILILQLTAAYSSYAKGFFPFESSSNSESQSGIDAEETTPYDEAIDIVCGLGFMDRNSELAFGINDNITYSDLKDIIYRISFKEYSFENESENVTFEGIAECFIDVLGYSPIAKGDLLYYANSIGLFKGVDIKKGEAVTKSQAAQIVYNSLEINLCEQTGFGDNYSYEIQKGKTLLYNMEIKELKGFVNANSYMNFFSSEVCENDEIEIDRSVYKIGEINTEEFIGRHIVAYIDISDTKNEKVLFITTDNSKNPSVELKINNYKKATVVSGGISYLNKTYKISSDAYVVNNFKFAGKYSSVNLSSLLKGQVRAELFDSDCDGKYDIVSVSKAKDYFVKQFVKINENKYVITDNSKQADLVLDYSDDVSIYISKGGSSVSVSTIKIGQVLSVTQSEGKIGKKIIKIDISEDFAEGRITSVSNEGIQMDNGEIYYPSESFEIDDNWSDSKYKIYLSDDGSAVYAEKSDSEEEYFGFLVGALAKDEFSDGADFKIFTTDGEFEIFSCESKMLLSVGSEATFGVPAPEYRLMPAEVANHSEIKGKSLAIKYQLNEKNEISKLITPSDNSKTGLIDTENFSIDFSGTIRRYNDYYSSRFRSLGKVYLLSVPLKSGSDEVDVDNEDEFSIPTLSFDQEGLNVTVYDALESGGLSNSLIVCSVKKSVSVKNNSENIAVVKGISTAYVNEEVVKAVEIYKKSGVESTLYLDSDTKTKINVSEREEYSDVLPQNLKEGDIIQYEINSKNIITAFRLLCRTSDKKYYEYYYQSASVNNVPTSNVNNLSPLTHGYGKVMAVDIVGDKVCMSVNCRDDEEPTWNRSLTVNNVICYDSESNTVSVMQKSDILKGDSVFYLHSWGYEAKTVILIR